MKVVRFVFVLLFVLTLNSFAKVPEWLQTARIFLIDAYQYPFQPKFEYDAEKTAQMMEEMNVNIVRFGTMGKFSAIQGIRFTVHPDQGNRDCLTETIEACKKRNIKVIPYISTGHKLGLSMLTRDYPEYAYRPIPGGPVEELKEFNGEPDVAVCWNTPYKEAFYDYVEHVVRDYDIEGIYFDTWWPFYYWRGVKVCHCEGCQTKFKKFSGHDLPYHENENDYTAEELAIIDEYHDWYYEVMIDILYDIRKMIKSYKDIPMIINLNNPIKMSQQDPRVIAAMDAFLYEKGSTMLERAEGVSLARSMGLGVFPYIGTYNNWPRVMYNGIDYQQQIYTTVMFGGAPIIAQPQAYADHTEYRKYVEEPFDFLNKHEADFSGFVNNPHVAVVYQFKNPPGHEKKGWWWKMDTRTATLGAFAACLYQHIQVSSAMESLLDSPEELAKYKVLYLADVPYLTEQRIKNIKEYVRNGGGLIVGYATSLYDENGKKQEKFGLEELIQVKPGNYTGEKKFIIDNYTCMLGGPNELYYLAKDNNGQLSDYWKGRLVPLWHYEPIKVLDGGKVLMDVVTGDDTRLLMPGVVLTQYGKGKVLYSSSSLESLYSQNTMSVLGYLIKEFVNLVQPESRLYKVDAPKSCITNLTQKGNTFILHLTNWTGNKLEREDMYEYYLAPIENVKVELTAPKGKKITAVSPLVAGEVKQTRSDNSVKILIPRIDAYQGIRFTITE